MKTLVIYASKYGSTKSCASDISNSLDDSEIRSCEDLNTCCLESYERVIVGVSFYFGRFNKSLLGWLQKNQTTLLDKELHFFTCSKETTIDSLVDKKLLNHAKQNAHFGYALRISKMSFIDRFVSKKIAQTSDDVNHLKPEQINSFMMGLKSS